MCVSAFDIAHLQEAPSLGHTYTTLGGVFLWDELEHPLATSHSILLEEGIRLGLRLRCCSWQLFWVLSLTNTHFMADTWGGRQQGQPAFGSAGGQDE